MAIPSPTLHWAPSSTAGMGWGVTGTVPGGAQPPHQEGQAFPTELARQCGMSQLWSSQPQSSEALGASQFFALNALLPWLGDLGPGLGSTRPREGLWRGCPNAVNGGCQELTAAPSLIAPV